MSEQIKKKVQHKFSVLEDFGKTQPHSEEFISGISEVVQAALVSCKTSALKRIDQELDILAEEFFVTDATRQYRERYWRQAESGVGSSMEEGVRRALREQCIQNEDQMRTVLLYLDQIAMGLRKNCLNELETEQLSVLARRFKAGRNQ